MNRNRPARKGRNPASLSHVDGSRRLRSGGPAVDAAPLERYKFILQQLNALNENSFKVLALYQTLATATIGAGLALFVGYRNWEIDPVIARSGLVALLWLLTIIASFTILLLLIGILSWLDYRKEECELTDQIVYPGFRDPPRLKNALRWHEGYLILFVVCATAFVWVCGHVVLLPAMH